MGVGRSQEGGASRLEEYHCSLASSRGLQLYPGQTQAASTVKHSTSIYLSFTF